MFRELISRSITSVWFIARRLYRIPELGFPHFHVDRPNQFDRALGIDTTSMVRLTKTSSKNIVHGVRYQASEIRLVEWALVSSEVDFENTTFVDVGCGKGRVLILACRKPFNRIIGFDYSESVLNVCRKNLRHLGLESRCEVCHEDASKFQFPDGNLMLFFYNPFHSPLFEEVLERIRSIKSPVTIVYLGPKRDALDCSWLRKIDQLDYASIYKNQRELYSIPS